ncbi:MAG: WbqC family protein [Muribaculaceae bacterium]|nr:WbqC family protein [Muribaculaceae bacterium]
MEQSIHRCQSRQVKPSSPLIVHHDITAVLPPLCCGNIGFYATLAQYANVVIDCNCRYNKRQKDTHRYTIADTHGQLQLTIPIEKPLKGSKSSWNDVNISTHGAWWNVHRVALESAYGRTPFFEYYIDRFKPFLSAHNEGENLMKLIRYLDQTIREILLLDNIVTYDTDNISGNIKDYRNDTFSDIATVEYYQLRKAQLGFISNLSILDLIFNMGPESPLILKKIIS